MILKKISPSVFHTFLLTLRQFSSMNLPFFIPNTEGYPFYKFLQWKMKKKYQTP
jgi:hypothetical protein